MERSADRLGGGTADAALSGAAPSEGLHPEDAAMSIAQHCRIPVVTVTPERSVREAAQRMGQSGVGALVVVEEGAPVGMVTDRDIALEVLCKRLDADAVPVREIMHRPVVTLPEDTSIREATRFLRLHALRRLPVVDDSGRVVGLIAVDDLVGLIARELRPLAEAIASQLPRETPEEERIQTIDRSE